MYLGIEMSVRRDKPLCIRDPLYGFIEFSDLEEKIIQTNAFQRLRHIKQLGTTSWIFPSANHTRFEHSLGVFHLSKRILDTINKKNQTVDKKIFTSEDQKIFRLASLLHDIGHAPFSHVGEKVLFPNGDDHESVGKKIIEYEGIDKLIADELGDHSVDRIHFITEAVKTPASPMNRFFRDMLTGSVGIDRMDYLRRDSYFLGVEYGRFDIERILETLVYPEEKRDDDQEGGTYLYWEEGGTQALEHFVLARYFMYTQIYYHKTTRILNYHLIQAMKDFLSTKFGNPTFPTDPSRIKDFLDITTMEILDWIWKSDIYKPVFYDRKFYKFIRGSEQFHELGDENVIWKDLETHLNKNPEFINKFFIDKPPSRDEPKQEEDISDVKLIRVKKNEEIRNLPDVSPIVKQVKKPVSKMRLYSDEKLKDSISKEAKRFINNHEKYINVKT